MPSVRLTIITICSVLILCTAGPAAADESRCLGVFPPLYSDVVMEPRQVDLVCLVPAVRWDPYWTRVAARLSYFHGSGRRFFILGATLGPRYHLWDDQWAWDPVVDGIWATLFAAYASEHVYLGADGRTDAEATRLRIGDLVGPVENTRFHNGAVIVSAGGVTGSPDDDANLLGGAVLEGRVGSVTVERARALASRPLYEEELTLKVLESRQLDPDEVEGLRLDADLHLVLDVTQNGDRNSTVTFGGALQTGVGMRYVDGSESVVLWGGRGHLRLMAPPIKWPTHSRQRYRDGWFELRARGSAQTVLSSPGAPVIFLPDLGNPRYGMLAASAGLAPDLAIAVAAGEVGTSFLRGFVEYGRSWGLSNEDAVGFGGILQVPHGLWRAASQSSPAMGLVFSEIALSLGGTLSGEFVGRLLVDERMLQLMGL